VWSVLAAGWRWQWCELHADKAFCVGTRVGQLLPAACLILSDCDRCVCRKWATRLTCGQLKMHWSRSESLEELGSPHEQGEGWFAANP